MKIAVYGATRCEKKLLQQVAAAASTKLNQTDENVFACVYFCSKGKIKRLNDAFRGINQVTAVLSFPAVEIAAENAVMAANFSLDVDYSTGKLCLGDIFICRAKARAQAKEYGHSRKREKAFLALHGMLHLLGYDHQTQNDETRMQQLQSETLNEMGLER